VRGIHFRDKMENLKRCIREFRDVDNELRELNRVVADKREKRKNVELEMADIIKNPIFQGYDKLKIDDDGSLIRIKKPDTYMKPWSISQRDLKDLLDKYFSGPQTVSCFDFIVAERKKDLVAHEYSFERVVKSDE